MSRMADRMLTGTIDVPHWVWADVSREDIARQREDLVETLTSVPVIAIKRGVVVKDYAVHPPKTASGGGASR
jgi:hypothetical protein